MGFEKHDISTYRLKCGIKMRGSSLFLVQVVTMFAVKAVNSAPVKKNSLQGSPTTGCNAEPTNNCNCHCNVFQDSRITKAVNALENKVDQFIEVVNDTAPPGLSPGIMILIVWFVLIK